RPLGLERPAREGGYHLVRQVLHAGVDAAPVGELDLPAELLPAQTTDQRLEQVDDGHQKDRAWGRAAAFCNRSARSGFRRLDRSCRAGATYGVWIWLFAKATSSVSSG